jgi:RND superfamily putative drug exporter
MFERWTRAVVRHRVLVLALWLLVALMGIIGAAKLPNLLTSSLNVPNSNSARANGILAQQFHDNIEGSFAIVVPDSSGATDIASDVRRAIRFIPGAVVTQQRRVGSTWYVNVDTSLSLTRAAQDTTHLREALRNDGVANALVTGPPALQNDIAPVLASDLRRGELVTLVVAMIVLLVALGLSWAIALPFLVAGATASLSLLALFLLAHKFTMVLYVPNIVELLALGLALDYSLFILHRFRTELDGTKTVDDAIVAALSTAGRTVMFSGLAVAIALATLLLVPVPFVRSLSIAGLCVPIAGIVGAVTLQPVLLSLLGRRGVRQRRLPGLLNRSTSRTWWARSARVALRRPKLVLGASLVIVAVLAAPLGWLQLTPASLTAIPHSMSSAKAIRVASAGVGPGFLTPIEIVIDSGRAEGAEAPAVSSAQLRLAKATLRNPDVELVAIGKGELYVSDSGRYERVFVITRHQFGSSDDQTLVGQLRSVIIPAAKFPATSHVYVGGAASQGVDFLNDLYSNLGWLLAIALLATYFVLARAFRSALLPLVAVLLDLCSLAGAYGVLVAVIHFGVGSAWLGTYHVSQIEGWVPLLIFAVLFGLSMDYEVFVVSRIREGVDRGLSTRDAIEQGLGKAGGVIGAAALIMIGATAGFVSGHIAGLQELGVGLGAGVVVDTTIVRGLILPSVMGLLGRWNWWLPSPLATVLHTQSQGSTRSTPVSPTSESRPGS